MCNKAESPQYLGERFDPLCVTKRPTLFLSAHSLPMLFGKAPEQNGSMFPREGIRGYILGRKISPIQKHRSTMVMLWYDAVVKVVFPAYLVVSRTTY